MSEKPFEVDSKDPSTASSVNVISEGMFQVTFKDPLEDVHTAVMPIAGCAWVDTTDGVVLIDTLINIKPAERVMERIKGKIKYIIYTHGHMDHVGGAKAFMKDDPEVLASKYLPDRFEKYQITAAHRSLINQIQFNLPPIKRPVNYVYPTKTFLGDMTFTLGDKTFELHTDRAETDDAVWVWVPEIKCAFIGDLMVGVFPNIGNPYKPTRFALDWAKALEKVRAFDPEFVFCNGGGVVYEGKKAKDALDANIEVIRDMHDQVVKYINEDMHITEMIHKVKVPDHLKKSPYLRQVYSRPEFFVFNVYRWYHGYFDHNPANLLPRPEKEVMNEIFNLIGDSSKILDRAKDLLESNQPQLGLQVLDVLIQAEPVNIAARELRVKILTTLSKGDKCLMSKNAWFYSLKLDKKLIRSLKRKNK